MENHKQNTNVNGGKNPLSLSSNHQYGLNTPLSINSLVELVPSAAKKTSIRPMKAQMGLLKQNKRAVPQNPEKPESRKKMRKDVDPGSNSFVAWSPGSRECEVAKKAYPTRGNKSSTTNKSPTSPNMNGCSRQNDSVVEISTGGVNFDSSMQTIESGRANDTNIGNQSPVGANLDSSSQIVEFGPMKSSENSEEKHSRLVENVDYQTLEDGELMPSFENFKVIVNGYNIDSALGDDMRAKYFDLCFSQGSYLHAHLPKIINCEFAVVIISNVIEISEWIRNCNLVSNLADFEERRSILRGFELFGMNLGFLINRLNTIYGIVVESTMEVDLEKCRNAKTERIKTEEEKNELDLKLFELEKKMVRLDSEIETIEENADKYESMIRKEAASPW